MSLNPLKKEYTNEGENYRHIFSEEKKDFLLGLDRNIVGFTGNYKQVINNLYTLETYIYRIPDLYNRSGLEYDSIIFLDKKPHRIEKLFLILLQEFWSKGWIHGDLDSSNIVIQYEGDHIYFRIFDFEYLEYKNPGNNVGYFKFIWSDVRKFIKEYLRVELIRNTDTNRCYWFYDNKYLFETKNKIENILCDIIDMDDDKHIILRKVMKDIVNFVDNFSVGKYLYDFKDDDGVDNFSVVGDKMIQYKR